MDKRLLLILGISIIAVVILFSFDPIKQDTNYHLFADTRNIAYLPNCLNIISNLPFLIVGYLGLRLLSTTGLTPGITELNKAYLLFFIGVFLTGLGSGYYHYSPDNASLLWDRLPMTISFMAFFCIVVGECIATQLAQRLLFPLLSLGIASVFYWYFSELLGRGDLRPYALVQFLPLVLMPLILWLYDGKQKGCNYVWIVLGAYLLSKIAEKLDEAIYLQFYIISGHSVKHLFAALGAFYVYAALKKRKRLIEDCLYSRFGIESHQNESKPLMRPPLCFRTFFHKFYKRFHIIIVKP
jgi:Ceramidase